MDHWIGGWEAKVSRKGQLSLYSPLQGKYLIVKELQGNALELMLKVHFQICMTVI